MSDIPDMILDKIKEVVSKHRPKRSIVNVEEDDASYQVYLDDGETMTLVWPSMTPMC